MTRIPAYHYVISNLCTLDIDKMKKMQKIQYKESISRPCPKAFSVDLDNIRSL